MKGLIKDKASLEIIRNIIRETMLGNTLAFVLSTLAKNLLAVSTVLKYIPCTIFGVSAILVLFWMISIVTLYFNELERLIGAPGIWIMAIWAITFEFVLVFTLFNLLPLLK